MVFRRGAWCLGEVLVMLEEVLAGLEEVLVMLEEVLAMLEEVLVMLEEVLWESVLALGREGLANLATVFP